MLTIAIIIIVLIPLLLSLDYSLGKKEHKRNLRWLEFTKKSGDYTLYTIGDPFFTAFFQDLRAAKKRIDIMFFIVKRDEISNEFLSLLKDKAKEGVSIRLQLDRVGSHQVGSKIRKELEASGIQFAYMAKPGFPYLFYKLQRRNHRKIAVIDGEVGYVGGFNVGKEYLGRDTRLGNWRDYHLRLEGNIVQDLQETFLDDWFLSTGEENGDILVPNKSGNKDIEIVATDGGQLEDVFISMIEEARKEIFIGTPYFIPSERLFQSLLRARQRGVDVKVIVPMKSDHPFVKEAGLPYLSRLTSAGGEVYMFDLGFYHAKVLIIDEKLCDIGTANFDRRSLFLNKEVNTLIYNNRFVVDLRLAFLRDMQDSQEFNAHYRQLLNFGTKIRIGIAYLLRPFL